MSAMWKLEKDLCRCCHAEGSFKHLSDPCFLLGQEEIYSVMLKDCLDIKIVPMTGPLSDATYTICEACVGRLRDASNFKRQVQDCEQRFKEMYSKNMVKGFEVKAEPFEGDAAMKQESRSVDESDDDDEAFMKFDDELSGGDTSYEEHEEAEEMITVEIQGEPSKGKGKLKARRKTPNKRAKKEKPIKTEGDDSTEATASGEKKKGRRRVSEYLKYCLKTGEGASLLFTCKVCDKNYPKRRTIRAHIQQIHLKQKKISPCVCVICRVPLTPYTKFRHMEEVHGHKPHTCGACGKKFPFESRLKKHQRLFHLGEKDFRCEHCGMAFSIKQSLQIHTASWHSNERPFICEYCSKTFKHQKALRVHLRKVHMNEARYVCRICGGAFLLNDRLQRHMKVAHPNPDTQASVRVPVPVPPVEFENRNRY